MKGTNKLDSIAILMKTCICYGEKRVIENELFGRQCVYVAGTRLEVIANILLFSADMYLLTSIMV